MVGRPVIIFPAEEHHCPLASTKLYYVITGAQVYVVCLRPYAVVPSQDLIKLEPMTCQSYLLCSTDSVTTSLPC